MNCLSDEQLIDSVRAGQSSAEDTLARRYIRLVRVCARPYFLHGGDSEDLLQEGMLGLLYAIREYDPKKGAAFRTYAETCIRSRLQSAVRSASRKKHAPLNDGIPLDDVLSDETQALGTQLIQRSPEEQVLARETENELISVTQSRLSGFEARILALYLEGLSYQEMASVTRREVKSVDNAVQRLRKKLANLPSSDNSES